MLELEAGPGGAVPTSGPPGGVVDGRPASKRRTGVVKVSMNLRPPTVMTDLQQRPALVEGG